MTVVLKELMIKPLYLNRCLKGYCETAYGFAQKAYFTKKCKTC